MPTAEEIVQKQRQFLKERAQAYRVTFNPEGVQTRRVLTDLAKFCRAGESTFHTDARVAALMEGRREVWLRIQQHLQLTDDELWALLTG